MAKSAKETSAAYLFLDMERKHPHLFVPKLLTEATFRFTPVADLAARRDDLNCVLDQFQGVTKQDESHGAPGQTRSVILTAYN